MIHNTFVYRLMTDWAESAGYNIFTHGERGKQKGNPEAASIASTRGLELA